MGFAVLHIEKGTAGKAGGLGAHIDRTKRVPNADPNLRQHNFYVRPDFEKQQVRFEKEKHKKSLQERINDRIKEGYKGKTAIRKDAVTHLNVVMSGSHKDLERLRRDPKQLLSWAAENYKFMVERYDIRNIVEFSVHMDERTPHIHCVVVPLTKDGRLSAKEVMGNSKKLSELQDSYGKRMQEKFNLQRGVKGSTATHDSVKEYYARISQSLQYPSCSAELYYNAKAPQVETPPLIGREKWAERQNKAISESFTNLREHYKGEAEKEAKKVLDYYQTSKLQAEERSNRLRKENAQLKGIIKEQDKKLHPEKYLERERQQSRGRGLGL